MIELSWIRSGIFLLLVVLTPSSALLAGFGPEARFIVQTETAWPLSVYAADLDADGDLDMLSASWFDDKIAWYENE